jgi:hypothetical protein
MCGAAIDVPVSKAYVSKEKFLGQVDMIDSPGAKISTQSP